MADNPMYALTRYCMVAGEQIHESRKICVYDCLINMDSITIAADKACPITVKQLVYVSGRSQVVMR
jgi:hypothetical protein